MAITINGTGTITGLSTGGLPDGSVATDDLAANAVTAGKLATTLDLTGKTVTLPAGVGGKILQVVQASATAVLDLSTTTPTSRVSLSITPTSSSNKVLLFYHQGDCLVLSAGAMLASAFYRNGSQISKFTQEIARNTSAVWMMISGMYLDSPATTSSITYAVYHWNQVSSGTARFGDSGIPGVLTAMEVAA
jgi:hypothetical protein